MTDTWFAHWRRNFFAGLAVILPAVVSIAIVVWLFGTVTNFTDRVLFFLPRRWTHAEGGTGSLLWYCSLLALLVVIVLISLLGALARYYVGKQLIGLFDQLLLRIPLLNKIYSTIKQVNEAFSSGKKSSFKQVVLVEFPRAGQYSIGFITGEQSGPVQVRPAEKMVSVFVPTTPNPTSGFLVLMPEREVTKLNMSVADGIRFIISLGSVSPETSRLPEKAPA